MWNRENVINIWFAHGLTGMICSRTHGNFHHLLLATLATDPDTFCLDRLAHVADTSLPCVAAFLARSARLRDPSSSPAVRERGDERSKTKNILRKQKQTPQQSHLTNNKLAAKCQHSKQTTSTWNRNPPAYTWPHGYSGEKPSIFSDHPVVPPFAFSSKDASRLTDYKFAWVDNNLFSTEPWWVRDGAHKQGRPNLNVAMQSPQFCFSKLCSSDWFCRILYA